MKPQLFTLPEILEFVPLKRSTLFQQMKDGIFPRPVKFGGNRNFWRKKDILNWFKEHDIEVKD